MREVTQEGDSSYTAPMQMQAAQPYHHAITATVGTHFTTQLIYGKASMEIMVIRLSVSVPRPCHIALDPSLEKLNSSEFNSQIE